MPKDSLKAINSKIAAMQHAQHAELQLKLFHDWLDDRRPKPPHPSSAARWERNSVRPLGTAAVPIIGTALGALAGWLVGELTGVLFADCDGPVAAGVHVFASEDLIGVTALGAALTGTDYSPGTNSPVGCGSNSDYYVDWSVGAASPPSTAPRPDPIGGGRPLPIGAPTRLQ